MDKYSGQNYLTVELYFDNDLPLGRPDEAGLVRINAPVRTRLEVVLDLN